MLTRNQLQLSETGVDAELYLIGVASSLIASRRAISNETVSHLTSLGGGFLDCKASDLKLVLRRLAELDGSKVSHTIEVR